MNILYISNLTGNLFAGPNHSVPAQIKAQSRKDSVLWYNLNNVKREEWIQDDLDCKNLSDFPSQRIKDLPQPFCHPDLVVLEEVYCYPFSKTIKELQRREIPYIIVPRSQLTKQAQQKRAWKKKIGNFLYFKKMVRRASAIQYLSEQEWKDSGAKWNKNSLIIPNGTDSKRLPEKTFVNDGIHAVYVGRYEIYQKGLDILFEAIGQIKNELIEKNFHLSMYGVDQEGSVKTMRALITQYDIADIVQIHDAVYGQEKADVLTQADAFIMTSRFEGLPMGMIEALAYGLPVLATQGTNLADVVEAADAGWTSDNTVDGVVRMLNAAIMDKDQYKKKSNNALALSKQYSWEGIAEKTHTEYSAILNKPNKSE